MMETKGSRIDDPAAVLEALQRSYFPAFLAKAFELLSGGRPIDWNWHLDAIAYRLEQVQRGQSNCLLVTLPPRNLKSITISVAWVAFMLGQDPRLQFMCASYSTELAGKPARLTRDLMSTAWYRRLFPRTIISGRSAVHDFETTQGGGRFATSTTGTATGRGGSFIIIDDPIKADEAESETVRKAVNEWYKRTVSSRLDDKKAGATITVMQRLHEDDLAGLMIEQGELDHLNLAAIAPEDEIVPLTRGRTRYRKAGSVLDPSREPIEVLRRIERKMGSRVFAAQYLQQPVPATGNIILAKHLVFVDRLPEWQPGDQIIQSWDTAVKDGERNDWSVCVTALVRGRHVYVLDVFRRRMLFTDLFRTCQRLAREWHASEMLIEDSASGSQLAELLRDEAPRGVPLPLLRAVYKDKKTRVIGVSPLIEAGQLVFPKEAPWLAECTSELLGFPHRKHDDQVDAISQLLEFVSRLNRWKEVEDPGPISADDARDWIDDDDDPYGL